MKLFVPKRAKRHVIIYGTGEWRLNTAPGGTRGTYEIDVVANGRLAVVLGWLLPLGRIHSKLMREVPEGLQHETGWRVVGSDLVRSAP